MNILFHGASVTEQKDTTGYFENVVNLNQSRSYKFFKNGYGGSHLEDAAFATIDEDSDANDYDICFLDWNTTGNPEFEPYKLQYIVEVLLSKKILPVFLILARTDTINRDRTCELQVKKICEEYDLLCLDYRESVDPAKHLRDYVHTNTAGGMLYGRLITRDLPRVREHFLKRIKEDHFPKKINRVSVDEHIVCYENEELIFKNVKADEYSEVIVEHLKAPYSPVILMGDEKLSLWDPACHYERRDYFCIKPDANGDCRIKVLDEAIDYSTCRRENFNYEGQKYVNISKVYYINSLDKSWEKQKAELKGD